MTPAPFRRLAAPLAGLALAATLVACSTAGGVATGSAGPIETTAPSADAATTCPTAQPEPAHLLWMAVDLLSAGLDDDDAFAGLVDATGIADVLPAPDAIDIAVGLDHPHTSEVLRLLADHLDDQRLAKQLRRALTKAKAKAKVPRTPKTRPPGTSLPGL